MRAGRWFALASLAASFAWAEPVIAVQAEVVHASTKAGEVDASLKKMQDTLGSKVKYGTMKKLETKRIDLRPSPTAWMLPNKKTAELKLESLKDGVATVRVKVPPTDATYTLAKDKSLYLQAGPHEDGELWLVLSQPK